MHLRASGPGAPRAIEHWPPDASEAILSPHKVPRAEVPRSVVVEALRRGAQTPPACERPSLEGLPFEQVIRRAVNLLAKATRRGSSVDLLLPKRKGGFENRSSAAELLEGDGAAGMAADERSQAIGLVCLLLLAGCGVVALLDRFLFPNAKAHRSSAACWCRICSGEISVGEMLGEGGGGRVFTCMLNDRKRVVKMIRINMESDINALGDALEEAKNLIELQHPHVVAYDDFFIHRGDDTLALGFGGGASSFSEDSGGAESTGKDFVCIVMEYADGGNLLDHIGGGVPLHLDVLLSAMHQILEALVHIHRRHIIHFDVKLENIFLTSSEGKGGRRGRRRRRRQRESAKRTWQLKVGDFGLAVHNRSRPSEEPKKAKKARRRRRPPHGGSFQEEHDPPRRHPYIAAEAHALPLLVSDGAAAAQRLTAPPEAKAHPKLLGETTKHLSFDASSLPHGVSFAPPLADLETRGPPSPTLSQLFRSVAERTKSAVVGGTAPYQGPECFDGTDADDLTPMVDAWALGCTLYEAVTCRSLPAGEPYLGQAALAPEEQWQGVRRRIRDNFSASIAIMLQAAGADKNEIGARERRVAEQQRRAGADGLTELLMELLERHPEDRPDLREVKARTWWRPFVHRPIHLPDPDLRRRFARAEEEPTEGDAERDALRRKDFRRAKSAFASPMPLPKEMDPLEEMRPTSSAVRDRPVNLFEVLEGADSTSSDHTDSD